MESLSTLASGPVAAVERAAVALGRLEGLVESSGEAVAEAFPLRKSAALTGCGGEGVVAMLLGENRADHRRLQMLRSAVGMAVPSPLSTDALLETLDAAGASPPDTARGRIVEAASIELHLPTIVRAAAAFGAIVSSAPATRESLCSASLAADLLLASGGVAVRSRVAPVQLDAATRSAAVQIERSGDWSEWVRAWSAHLAREAAAAERAARALMERHGREAVAARAQHRVGATDAQVLVHLQGVLTFTIPEAAPVIGFSVPTVGTSIERLEAARVATELTGQKRDRVWISTALLEFMVGR